MTDGPPADPDTTQVDLPGATQMDLGATQMDLDVEAPASAADPEQTMMPMTDRHRALAPEDLSDPEQTMMPITGRLQPLGDASVVGDPDQTMMPITGRLTPSADLTDPERTHLDESRMTQATPAGQADPGQVEALEALIARQEAQMASQDALVRELAAQVTGLQDELLAAAEELKAVQAEAARSESRKLRALEHDVEAFEAEAQRTGRVIQVLEEKVKHLHGRRDTLAIVLFVVILLAVLSHLLR